MYIKQCKIQKKKLFQLDKFTDLKASLLKDKSLNLKINIIIKF